MSDDTSTTDDTLIGGGLLLVAIAISIKIMLVIVEIANWFAGAMLVIGATMFVIGLIWRWAT